MQELLTREGRYQYTYKIQVQSAYLALKLILVGWCSSQILVSTLVTYNADNRTVPKLITNKITSTFKGLSV